MTWADRSCAAISDSLEYIGKLSGSDSVTEGKFDRLRGGPDSAYRVSEWVGPLSALPFHHGFTLARNPRFQPAKCAHG